MPKNVVTVVSFKVKYSSRVTVTTVSAFWLCENIGVTKCSFFTLYIIKMLTMKIVIPVTVIKASLKMIVFPKATFSVLHLIILISWENLIKDIRFCKKSVRSFKVIVFSCHLDLGVFYFLEWFIWWYMNGFLITFVPLFYNIKCC